MKLMNLIKFGVVHLIRTYILIVMQFAYKYVDQNRCTVPWNVLLFENVYPHNNHLSIQSLNSNQVPLYICPNLSVDCPSERERDLTIRSRDG